jgi:hypothetical protein
MVIVTVDVMIILDSFLSDRRGELQIICRS